MSWRPWRRKPKPPQHHPLPGWPAGSAHPDSLSDDLKRHLYEQVYAVRRGTGPLRWVMTGEWLNECRKIDSYRPLLPMPPGGPDYLLGVPVEVREGSGPPHLEQGAP